MIGRLKKKCKQPKIDSCETVQLINSLQVRDTTANIYVSPSGCFFSDIILMINCKKKNKLTT